MSKPSFLTESFGRRSLPVVLALILLLVITVSQVAPSQEDEGADRQEAIRRIVKIFIQTGQKEYDEGFFEQAEKTFLMAQGYEKDLTVDVREQLNELLGKSRIAVLERKSALETFLAVIELIKQDQLIKAKAYLEKIRDNEFLTKEERIDIDEIFRQIDAQVIAAKAQLEKAKITKPPTTEKSEEAAAEVKKPVVDPNEQKKEVTDIFYRSVVFYDTGQFEKAREGFVKVASSNLVPPSMKKTSESYLTFYSSVDFYNTDQFEKAREGFVKVSSINLVPPSMKKAAEVYLTRINQMTDEVVTPKAAPKVAPEAAPRVASPVTGQSSYIDVINRRRNVIRSHTRAVVNDAIAKARSYVNQARFDKAKNVVETAALTVNKNQMHLGDALFKEYSSKLEVLTEEIVERENEKIRQAEREKRRDATEAQRRYREQMEIEREERIAELMENARTYQKQQRYEAALGQLVSLLLLDPQNEQALVLKDTLEDMIYFRKQLEVLKESKKQRADVLLKTDESGIPYAEELTYPPYWRELIAKPTRQPDEPIGLDPLDAVVYKQLEKTVDLSDLTPGMSFGEVIEKLENSVTPPIQIQPNWKDLLENAEVDPATAAGMDPLTGVKLRKALEILIAGVTSAQLGDFGELIYVVDEGVILIGTVDVLERPMVPRVYDISDLVAEPANFRGGGMGMGGMGMGGMGMGGMGMGGMGGMGGYGGGMGGRGGGMGGYGGGMGGYGGGMGGYGGGSGGGGLGGYGGGGLGGYGGGMGGYGGMGGGGMGGYGGMGGGGMGGYGGMGGGGMGGYGGGMGGYGGGMGGYGGGMGMMGGMGGMGGGMGRFISQDLVMLIQETIEPDTWFETTDTGEGTITPYPSQQPKKLSVLQTHEVHREIDKLLAALRESLGNQVSIEAVFLVVSENYLEDVGLDVDFSVNLGGKWGQLSFEQGSSVTAAPDVSTKVGGSLGGITASATIGGGYGTILDDLQVSFLLRAVQAHVDSKLMTAAKGTVLSGESAMFSVQDVISYALPGTTTSITQPAGIGTTGTTAGYTPNVQQTMVGSSLSISPTITHDKKHVLLNITTQLTDLLRMRTHRVEGPVGPTGEVEQISMTVPETETSSIMTRVSVPDGGTLLLGGQKITAEVEKEVGVPVLSKIPILGRLFTNRSTIKDHKILLILVKPTILLQEERDAEAIAGMEGE